MPDLQSVNTTGHPLWNDDVIVPITIVTDLLTLLLNILPIYTVVRQKRLFPYALDESIMAFSSVEIVTVLGTMPLGLTSYYGHFWPGGKVTCGLYQVLVIWSELITMTIVTTMGMERIACVKRLVAGDGSFKRHDVKKNRIRLAIILVLSLLLSIAPLVGLAPSGYSDNVKMCQSVLTSRIEHHQQYIFYLAYLMIGYFNVIINAVIYSSLIAQLVTLKKRSQNRQFVLDTATDSTELEQLEIRTQRKEVVVSTVMVTIVALIYYTTTIPALILVTIQKISHTVVNTRVLVYSLLVTNISGVCLPLVYPLVSRRYRLQYQRLLTMVCGCRPCGVQGDVLPDILTPAEQQITPDSEGHSDYNRPTESCQVIPKSSSIVFKNTGSIHTDSNQPIADGNTNSRPISMTVANCSQNIGSEGARCLNEAIMNGEVGVLEGDILEETTYITHVSSEEEEEGEGGGEYCAAGSRLNLMSSDED